jgi:hypothetical protein
MRILRESNKTGKFRSRATSQCQTMTAQMFDPVKMPGYF